MRGLAAAKARIYLLAALSALAGVTAQTALTASPNLSFSLLVSLLAVAGSAYFGGRGAAFFATAVNSLVNCYFIAEPRFTFAIADPKDAWRLAAFAAAGAGVSLWSRRLSGTRHVLRLALLLASSVVLIIVAALLWLDFENARASEAWVEHTYEALNASEQWLTMIQDAESSQRGYLLTGDEQYLAPYRGLQSAERAARDHLRALTEDNPRQRKRMAELDRLAGARLDRLSLGISVRREGSLEAAAGVVGTGDGARLMREIRRVLAAIETEEHRLLVQRTRVAAEQAARTRWVLGAGTALLVVLLLFAGAVIERDVSKLQASERVLRRQTELLDIAQEPIMAWELGGAIDYWNHGAEKLFGFSRQEAVGREHGEVLQPMHPLAFSRIEEQLALEGEWSGELIHIIAGREIVVDSRMTLVTEPDGRKMVLKTNRDVTEEKRAKTEIQQLNRELEQRVKDRTAELEASNRELETFAYAVSHDLRAPLRGIDGWSHALLEDYGPQLSPNGRHYLERVRTETQRMGQLIDGLLRLSRLTRVELHREPVDLSALARSILCRLRETEPQRDIDLEIQDGLTAIGDQNLLEVALSNLMINAVKFTARRALARIEFAQTRCGNEIAFYVRDNGVGFDMAYSGMLFGPFQRLHKHSDFPGTGIGLATTQRVLRRHGGRIWADAQPGVGATFYFTVGTAAVGEEALAAKMV